MMPALPSRSDGITRDSVADARWRLEQAIEQLDAERYHAAEELAREAGAVLNAMSHRLMLERVAALPNVPECDSPSANPRSPFGV